MIGNISPCVWSKFIRSDYIKTNNIQFPSNISFAEDLATSSSLFIFNPKVSTVDMPLYNYYTRSNSITNEINSKVLELEQAFNFIKKILNNYEIYEKNKHEFQYCVWQHMFFTWFLRYVNLHEKYSLILYKKYEGYKIDISSNTYIREKICSSPLSLKIRIYSYQHSYKLGRVYDNTRKLFKKGYQ